MMFSPLKPHPHPPSSNRQIFTDLNNPHINIVNQVPLRLAIFIIAIESKARSYIDGFSWIAKTNLY